MTDASFESIEHDDQPGVGPRALLLSGFADDEVSPIRRLLETIGAPDHTLRRCSAPMLTLTLEEALTAQVTGAPVAADQLPRVAVLSGLSGSQIHALIDSWSDTGLVRPIWASTTPNNLRFVVRDLLKELLAEQRAMQARSTPPESPGDAG